MQNRRDSLRVPLLFQSPYQLRVCSQGPGQKSDTTGVSGLPGTWAFWVRALPVPGAWFYKCRGTSGRWPLNSKGVENTLQLQRSMQPLTAGREGCKIQLLIAARWFHTFLFFVCVCLINPRAADVLLNVWQNACCVHTQGNSSNGSSVISLAVYLCCEN